MAVKAQPTLEESWARVTEECGWWMWLGKSSPPDRMSQILFMLMVELESLSPYHLGWSYEDWKTDLQQRFHRSQGQCWLVSGMSSIDPRSVILGFPCSLFTLTSFPCRMIRRSRVWHILDMWATQWKWCWRILVSMGRVIHMLIWSSQLPYVTSVWKAVRGPWLRRLWFWFLWWGITHWHSL